MNLSIRLGKFQFEHHVNKRIFLAPESFTFTVEDDTKIVKNKGLAKDLVTLNGLKRH